MRPFRCLIDRLGSAESASDLIQSVPSNQSVLQQYRSARFCSEAARPIGFEHWLFSPFSSPGGGTALSQSAGKPTSPSALPSLVQADISVRQRVGLASRRRGCAPRTRPEESSFAISCRYRRACTGYPPVRQAELSAARRMSLCCRPLRPRSWMAGTSPAMMLKVSDAIVKRRIYQFFLSRSVYSAEAYRSM